MSDDFGDADYDEREDIERQHAEVVRRFRAQIDRGTCELTETRQEAENLRAEVARLQAALTAEQSATADATRLMTLWQEREAKAVKERDEARNRDGLVTAMVKHRARAEKAEVKADKLRSLVEQALDWTSMPWPEHAARVRRNLAALATPQPPPGEACRNFDPWGRTTDQDGRQVDPRDCRVCGNAKMAHRQFQQPAAAPACDHHDDGVHVVIGDVGCECGYLAPAPAGECPAAHEFFVPGARCFMANCNFVAPDPRPGDAPGERE